MSKATHDDGSQREVKKTTHLDVISETLQQPGSPFTLHPTLLIIVLIPSVCMPHDLYPGFGMCDLCICREQMICNRGVVRGRDNEQDV